MLGNFLVRRPSSLFLLDRHLSKVAYLAAVILLPVGLVSRSWPGPDT